MQLSDMTLEFADVVPIPRCREEIIEVLNPNYEIWSAVSGARFGY